MTPDHDDLIERLREASVNCSASDRDASDAMSQAATALATLTAERARAALKPFVKCADLLFFAGATTADEIELTGEELFAALMAARKVLANEEGGNG